MVGIHLACQTPKGDGPDARACRGQMRESSLWDVLEIYRLEFTEIDTSWAFARWLQAPFRSWHGRNPQSFSPPWPLKVRTQACDHERGCRFLDPCSSYRDLRASWPRGWEGSFEIGSLPLGLRLGSHHVPRSKAMGLSNGRLPSLEGFASRKTTVGLLSSQRKPLGSSEPDRARQLSKVWSKWRHW